MTRRSIIAGPLVATVVAIVLAVGAGAGATPRIVGSGVTGDGVATNGVLHDAMLACLRPGKPLG